MRLRDLFPAGSFSGKSPGSALERAGALLLLLYLIAGVSYSFLLAPEARFTDEDEYLKLSDNLLHGPGYSLDGVHLTASRPPGYAFFLAGLRALGGGFFSFRVAQFLLLGATILLLCRLCSERKMVAGLLIITGLVICYPLCFYASATLYPQTLSGFLFILALTLILATPRTLFLNLAAGFSFGALILDVPTFLFTMVVVLGTAHFLKMIRRRDVLLITLAAFLLVGAWTARNAVCFHRFVPIASNSGMNFLEGNNGQATADEAAASVGLEPYYQQTRKLGLDEFQSDRFYQEAALAWIKTHPGHALVLYFEKVLNFFNIMNVYSPQTHGEISAWKQIVMAASYLLLLGLLGWRLLEIKRFPLIPREKLFLAVYVLSAFTGAIFFTRIRLRLPYDYLIIAVIALNLSRRLEIWMTAERPAKLPLPSTNQK
jgi:hypothetical protein